MRPILKLNFRGSYDRVIDSVEAANEWAPDDWPKIVLSGHRAFVPGVPELVDRLIQEFLDRGLPDLARRVGDVLRWRV